MDVVVHTGNVFGLAVLLLTAGLSQQGNKAPSQCLMWKLNMQMFGNILQRNNAFLPWGRDPALLHLVGHFAQQVSFETHGIS